MSKKFYLSIVVTTRNDNHGGDLLERTSCFVKGVLHQARKFKFPVELIIVEWNPPTDKPLLQEVLPKPAENDFVTLRYILVPNKLHQKFRFPKAIPLYQMIAKNVGIRRASGKFILCTNIDLLFSDDCFRLFAEQKLKTNTFYRANRCDVPKTVLEIKNFEEQLRFSEKNIMKRLGFPYNYKNARGLPDFLFWYPNALRLIDLCLGIFKPFHKKEKPYSIEFLDTMACGDFTIMAKEDWFRIKGYCELDMYSLHVDSMALISALAIGMKQEIFPKTACSYHIYHENGWESNYKQPDDLIRFLVKRPALDWHTVSQAGKKLLKAKKPFALNTNNWGFADQKLEIYTFSTKLFSEKKLA